MIKIICNKENLSKTGVYIFRNTISKKCYIGSTVVSFTKRLDHHLFHLRKNSHKNNHFQLAWNKYGEDVFEFDILEICDKCDCLTKEQYYLDTILHAKEFIEKKSDDFLNLGYNINPLASGTPNLSKETIEKRTVTFKEFISDASNYYSKFKKLELDFDDIPDKYISIINFWISNIPWNKGKSYESTDHLKVKKTISQKVLNARKFNSEKAREKSKSIIIYDSLNNMIKEFRSAADLEEWSKSSENNLDIKFIGKIKDKSLLSQNILKACKTGKPYKGFYFKFK